MRAPLLAVLLVFAAVPSMGQQRSVPSICVGCEERPPNAAAREQQRGRGAERASRRARATNPRRTVVPRVTSRGSAAESQLGSITRSLQQQQENLRASQQLQFEVNQMRNVRQPMSGGSLGCPAGSIGC